MGNCMPSQLVGRVRRTRLSADGWYVRVARSASTPYLLSADGWRARRARPTCCGWGGALGEHALPVVGGTTCCGWDYLLWVYC